MATKTYQLKPVVMARALAEMTVLFILGALPVILFLAGHFFDIHIVFRAGVCVVAPFALLGLWGFSQLAFKVEVNDEGLATRSILRRSFLAWPQIISLKQTNRMGLREYCLEHAGGSLSFPSLLNHVAELVDTIRSHLPNRGRSTTGDAQLYKVAPIMFLAELFKMGLQAGFSAIFFWFYDSLKHSAKVSSEDALFVLALAVLILLAVIWKLIQFFRLPSEVQILRDKLALKTLCKSTELSWPEISKLAPAGMLFPEGLMLSAGKHTYLIGNNVDCFDELVEEIQLRLRQQSNGLQQ
jgi:hypothetical protein